MKPFLQYVAEDIIQKHGTDLSRVAVVFPNKRAALFLSEYLAKLAKRPIWSPAYITISDLFRQFSTLQVADPIKQVCDLHKCFVEQTGIDETLDHFYGWGQLLIADFDDIDKNMADADRVLANLRDLHELDDISYLSDGQREVLRRFFNNFSDIQQTELKQRFLRLWSHMADIYHAFNHRLKEQGLAYEGSLYKEVIESNDLVLPYQCYLFIGFNMVHPVEQRLFALLQQQGRARFYWDFDHYYMKSNEAGHYIRQYLAHYPNEINIDEDSIYNVFSQKKDIAYISAPTENIQARYISTWLRQHNRIADGRKTAIVLCDEHMLPAAIHCLPNEVEKVNITTGYPLIQSPVASLLSLLFDLQTNGYATQRNCFRLHQVNALLRHPYISSLSDQADHLRHTLNEQKIYYPTTDLLALDENLQQLFTPNAHDLLELTSWLCTIIEHVAVSASSSDPLFQESVFRTYTLLNRLHELIEKGDLACDIITLQRLTNQLISSTSVPFHGEPAEGLQIMGVLETRNLDFDHVLLLSCNEGNMPKGTTDTSFIPYSLRKAYGLTTIDHKVSIYSYYFHRLLSRASDVTILYNNATTDGQTGEMSRFMLQLMVECPHPIRQFTLQAAQHFSPFSPLPIEKDAEVMQRLLSKFVSPTQTYSTGDHALKGMLTPTAINRYLRCPLQFYYNHVCDLRESDTNDEDKIDNRIFGNIFHEASRIVYGKLTARSHQILPADIEQLLKTETIIERAVDEAFRSELFKHCSAQSQLHMQLNGLQLINREVIIHYLRQLLQADRHLAPFTMIGLECDVAKPLTIQSPFQEGGITLNIGGRIDRLDCIRQAKGGKLRIIDYKTGSHHLRTLPDLAAIFKREGRDSFCDYYLQTFFYASLVSTSAQYNPESMPVVPALLFIQHAGAADYDPVLHLGREPIESIDDYNQQFTQQLTETISEMFNPHLPFTPISDRQRCLTCPYRLLCGLH